MEYQNHRMSSMDSNPYPPHNNPRYVMLSENGMDPIQYPPPHRRNIPRYHSQSKKSSCSCCKFICGCCCFFFVLLALLFGIAVYLVVSLDPKIPNYNVQNLDISAFDMQPDFSLYTEFVVTVKAENPNSKISILYNKGSGVAVTYRDSILCSGKLPAFRQGYHNTTILKVVLSGKSEFGSGLQEALMDNRQSGRIPLDIFVKVPVSLVAGSFEMREILVIVECDLVVDNLSPNKKVNILSTNYKVKVKF